MKKNHELPRTSNITLLPETNFTGVHHDGQANMVSCADELGLGLNHRRHGSSSIQGNLVDSWLRTASTAGRWLEQWRMNWGWARIRTEAEKAIVLGLNKWYLELVSGQSDLFQLHRKINSLSATSGFCSMASAIRFGSYPPYGHLNMQTIFPEWRCI